MTKDDAYYKATLRTEAFRAVMYGSDECFVALKDGEYVMTSDTTCEQIIDSDTIANWRMIMGHSRERRIYKAIGIYVEENYLPAEGESK